MSTEITLSLSVLQMHYITNVIDVFDNVLDTILDTGYELSTEISGDENFVCAELHVYLEDGSKVWLTTLNLLECDINFDVVSDRARQWLFQYAAIKG